MENCRQDSEKEQINPAAVLSIVGTVQSKILPTLFNSTDVFSGLLPRFIFIRATRQAPPLMSDETFTSQPILRQITASLLALEMSMEGGQLKPKRVHLTTLAYEIFHQWHDFKMTEAWHGSELDQSICAKLVAQTARIALLLHCLQAALDGTDNLVPLDESTMANALKIGDWIQSHQKQIWLSMGIADDPTLLPLERAIMETALEIDSTGITLNQDFNAKVIKCLGHEIDPSLLGREAIRLGLKSCIIGKCRGKQISPKVAALFREKLYA